MKDIKDLIDELFGTDEEKYECPECGKEFGTRKGLKLHAGQAHKDVKYTKVGDKDVKVRFIKDKEEKDELDLPEGIEEVEEVKEVDTP